MNVLIAVALLIWLISRARKKRAARPAPKEAAADKFGWIDEPELLDAATDDFI